MEDLMQINAIAIAFAAGLCWIAVQASPIAAGHSEASLLQRNSDLSAAARQTRKRHPAPATRPSYRGFADPSLGPDGRPYPVPEYLRGQCYVDEGYGRFTACSYR
jgi:hypothetical protein